MRIIFEVCLSIKINSHIVNHCQKKEWDLLPKWFLKDKFIIQRTFFSIVLEFVLTPNDRCRSLMTFELHENFLVNHLAKRSTSIWNFFTSVFQWKFLPRTSTWPNCNTAQTYVELSFGRFVNGLDPKINEEEENNERFSRLVSFQPFLDDRVVIRQEPNCYTLRHDRC